MPDDHSSPPTLSRRSLPLWPPAVLLALITAVLYWPATHDNFLSYDDDAYVTENDHVRGGLSLANIKWAFGNSVTGNWHPVTMLSHMLDCQFYGLRPAGHHLTSLLLHALNTALIFLLLNRLTGAVWRSALVAALFGWSAVNVESVAWLAERKTVLCMCFGLLTLLCYTGYARRADAAAQERKISEAGGGEPRGGGGAIYNSRFYWLALVCLALGLMSKSLLVTWPFVMLLLDYWPLDRFQAGRIRWLVLEKIPFLALVAAVSVATILTHRQMGDLQSLPIGARLGNALVSFCRYLGDLFWPVNLAVFYPHPGYWPWAQVLLAGGLVAGLTMLFWVKRRHFPFLLIGWLWFLGTLMPVIGIVQVGYQAMADRHAYIPSAGVFIMAVWGVSELARRSRGTLAAGAVAAIVSLLVCLGLTRHQLGYWQNDETLFRHAIAVTGGNYLAHNNLAIAFDREGNLDAAIDHLREAIRLKPDYAKAYENLGGELAKEGQTDQAVTEIQTAIRLDPDAASAHKTLGYLWLTHGRVAEAINEYQMVIRLTPGDAQAHCNLGVALSEKGGTEGAMKELQEAIRLKPEYAEAHKDLGVLLFKNGQTDGAIGELQAALRVNPDFPSAQAILAKVLALKNGSTGNPPAAPH